MSTACARTKTTPTSLINSLTATQAREMIRSGAIESGMIPKVEACLEMLDKGVRKIHIIDGRDRHSLLLEIYTTKGVGTEIIERCSPRPDGCGWNNGTGSEQPDTKDRENGSTRGACTNFPAAGQTVAAKLRRRAQWP